MKTPIALLSLTLAPLALAACDEPVEEPLVVGETEPAAEISFAPNQAKMDAEQPGAGNEYSYIDLLALEPNDGTLIAESTRGAGYCRFSDESGRTLLTVGQPTMEEKPGAGVVRPNGQPAMALYAQAGGSDYLTNGPTLERSGEEGELAMTVVVTKADDTGAATLLVKIPEGERDPYNGTWTCST